MYSARGHFTTRRFYPWLVIGIAALFLFYKYILQVSPSIMTNELMREFQVRGVGLGNLAASFFYSFLFAQLFVGILLDRYSPRYLTVVALLLCACGAYGFSQANSLYAAAWSRSLMGVGAAFATVSYMKLTSLWFKSNQYAFVGGLLASAAMLGAIAGQMPLSFVVNVLGWRHSLLLCAILGSILAILFYIVVRDTPSKKTSFVVSKENKKTSASTYSFQDIGAVLANKQNWLITLYSGLAFSPIDAFAGLWCIPFLEVAYRLPHTKAACFVSFIFLGLAFGSPLLGLLSDRLGKRRGIMLISACVALFSIIIIIYSTRLPQVLLVCLLFLFGFSTGAFMLGFALGRELNRLAVAATIVAFINTGDVVLSAVTEPLIGGLLDRGWNAKLGGDIHAFSVMDYRYALILLPLYILGSIILLLFIHEPRAQADITQAPMNTKG